jgi:hypothetical protein
MNGIVLVGLLSGMVFGALATLMRRFASFIILAPVIALPIVYLVVWREALIGHCFFAHNFADNSCEAFHALLANTLENAGDTVVVVVTHILVAFVLVGVLTVVRSAIANANMKSPYEKEQERLAFERRIEAQRALKARLEEQMQSATKAILAAREAREKLRAKHRQESEEQAEAEASAG